LRELVEAVDEEQDQDVDVVENVCDVTGTEDAMVLVARLAAAAAQSGHSTAVL
jgi:hypothetical protein